jgi:lambda family phage portal protein
MQLIKAVKDYFTKTVNVTLGHRAIKGVMKKFYNSSDTTLLTDGWTTSPVSPDQFLKDEQRTLRARSRQQYANNDYARKFINMLVGNVVGNGFKFQARIVNRSGKQDQLANKEVEKEFGKWCKSTYVDVTGKLNFADLTKLVVRTCAIDGEFLAIIHISASFGRWNFSLQVVDSELLPIDYSVNSYGNNGNYIKMGVEFNQWGRPVAYHFIEQDPNVDSYGAGNMRYIRIAADRVIHEFKTEYVNQKRGLPRMSTAMSRMKMLDGYEESAVVAARTGASKMGFFTSQQGASYVGDETAGDGSLISDADPGTFEQLPEGVEFHAYDPAYPHEQFPEFMKRCLRGIASGLGVSYNSFANDLEGVNFSSYRSGLIEERDMYVAEQEDVKCFLNRVYQEWLRIQLLLGSIKINGHSLDISKIEKYHDVSWQGKRWQWVDPLKDEKANERSLKNRTTSFSSIIRRQGEDPDEVFEEIANDEKRLDELGIKLEMIEVANETENTVQNS